MAFKHMKKYHKANSNSSKEGHSTYKNYFFILSQMNYLSLDQLDLLLILNQGIYYCKKMQIYLKIQESMKKISHKFDKEKILNLQMIFNYLRIYEILIYHKLKFHQNHFQESFLIHFLFNQDFNFYILQLLLTITQNSILLITNLFKNFDKTF